MFKSSQDYATTHGRFMYITRIAPSPTGHFHIGTARTALFNYLAAKATNGKMILRIDDTDVERSKQEYVAGIVNSLTWLGLGYDSFYRQSDRLHIYNTYALALLEGGQATKQEDGSIVLDLKDKLVDNWLDRVVGTIPVTDKDFELTKNLPLVRPNGMPVYNFASVVDDLDMGINYIIRGVDHTSNTAKQELLRAAIGEARGRQVQPIEYAHVGLITIGKAKMSKRNPEHEELARVLNYKSRGIHAEAFLNWILRMGWGPKKDDATTAMIPIERAVGLFLDGGNLRSSNAQLDIPKLNSYDRKYKARDTEHLAIGATKG